MSQLRADADSRGPVGPTAVELGAVNLKPVILRPAGRWQGRGAELQQAGAGATPAGGDSVPENPDR